MKRSVLVFSGGLDSTVLLFRLLDERRDIKALCINYGQRHAREVEHAEKIAQGCGVSFKRLDFPNLADLLGGSSLTSRDVEVPEGHYEEESMKSTVVPNRNMILLSLAIGHCVSLGFDSVAYAAHAGDHAIYPDCRKEFVEAMAQVAWLCDWKGVELEAPFLGMSKSEIVTVGKGLAVPFVDTWTCYKGGEYHCGKCGSCVERREAFVLAGVPDPTQYGEGLCS